MKVRVRLFSIWRERAGVAEAQLELPAGAQVRTAVDELTRRYPALARQEPSAPVLFSLNRQYAQPDEVLQDQDELAIFPPVSGGARSAGKGLLLLSGGFDSPVAGRHALRSGQELEAVHFTMEPYTDDASARKAVVLAGLLGLRAVTIVPLGDDLAEFTRKCEHRLYFVLLKRLMYRVAQQIARQSGASFLVTGENLGQVSSQTLANLAAIDSAAELPVVRPLLGYDKQEILGEARAWGTYDTSVGPELCDVLGPKHPSTHVSVERIEAEEAKVDVAQLVANALRKAYTVPTVPDSEPAETRVAPAPGAVNIC